MATPKDLWDKLDIISRLIIPILIAASVWLWNHEKTKSENAARMLEIAVSILSSDSSAQDEPDPIKLWAVKVLQDPTSPPPLSLQAAAQLSGDPDLMRRVNYQKQIETVFTDPVFDDIRNSMRMHLEAELRVTNQSDGGS